MTQPDSHDDDALTLRLPRRFVALAVACVLHAVAFFVASSWPEAKPAPKRIELTLATPPPPPPAADVAAPPAPRAPRPPRKPRAPEPAPTPVAPVLPPTPEDDHVPVPALPRSVDRTPAPLPELPRWQRALADALADSSPKPPRAATGVLAPSFNTLARVADADPRLHDEENERRMAQDYGAFFRRGLEQLRGNWHPDVVLDVTERDPTRRCGSRTRTTFAVAVLDKKGNVVDVDLKSESGCPALDDEAVAAFKRSAQFPYPPAGIFIGPDGTEMETARYPVRFIVTFDGGLHIDWRG